jgi:hypothetical protein
MHSATSQKVAVSIPDEVTGFLNWPKPSSRIMALRSIQRLTKMSTRNRPGVKGGRPARKTENHTAISKPTVYKMWEPRRLIILWGPTACYRDSFTFIAHSTLYVYNLNVDRVVI